MVMGWHRSGCTTSSNDHGGTIWHGLGSNGSPSFPTLTMMARAWGRPRSTFSLSFHLTTTSTQEVNPNHKPWRRGPQSSVSPWRAASPWPWTNTSCRSSVVCLFTAGPSGNRCGGRTHHLCGRQIWRERGPICCGVQIHWTWILAGLDLFILSWFTEVSQNY